MMNPEGLMSKSIKQILFWSPRSLSILFVLFLSLFALDVFGEGYSFWETILALLIHLIPNFILVVALVLAWRWEWVGAALFTGFGVWYIIETWGRFPWTVLLVIAGVPMLVGVLFGACWMWRKQIRA
jgi:hypothetical protein